MGLSCWPPFLEKTNKLIEKVAWAMCTGITSRRSPTFVTSYDHATETEIVILLLVWCFLGPNLLDEEAAVKFAWDVISYIRIYHLVKQGCACLLSSVP